MRTARILAVLLAAGLWAVAPTASAQETYPSKAVVLVTHSSAGAGGDIFLRQLGKHLEPILGVPLVVENVRGGASAKAVSYVATAKPDGYVLYGSTPTFIQTPLLTATKHDFRDLQPVANVFFDPMILYVRSESPYRSLKDLVADARKSPGKQKWGAATPGSVEHMIVHNAQKTAGIRVVPVTFEGGGDLLVAVLGGHVELGIGEPGEVESQVQAGKVRVLCSFTERRLEGRDWPTAKDEGVDIVVTKFRGLLGPRGMPKAVVQAWETAIEKVLESPGYQAYYRSVNLVPAFMGSAEYGRYLEQMNERLAAYIGEIGLKKKK